MSRQSFVPDFVALPNGQQQVPFRPSPSGGGLWNGRFDLNMNTRGGYTYGSITLDGVTIQGYVCHGSGVFRTQSELGATIIGQEAELSVEQRAAKARDFVTQLEAVTDDSVRPFAI